MMKKSQSTNCKQTEIGEIPRDWAVYNLGIVAGFQNGKSSPNRNNNYTRPVYGSTVFR